MEEAKKPKKGAKIRELRKIFEKQEEKTLKDLEKIKKKKKQTAGQKEQHELEEKNMKAFMRSLQSLDTTKLTSKTVKDAFNKYANSISKELREENPDITKSSLTAKIKKSWTNDLSEKERLEFIFNVFGKQHGSGLLRQDFFDELLQTDLQTINKFINNYPDQDLSYILFLRQLAPEKKSKVRNYNTLLQKYITIAKEYAVDHGANISDSDSYYTIINKLLTQKYPLLIKQSNEGIQSAKEKLEKAKTKLHQLFTADLSEKGYDTEQMTLADLISSEIHPKVENKDDFSTVIDKDAIQDKLSLSSKEIKKLKSFNERDERKTLESLTISEVIKIANQLGIQTNEDSLNNDKDMLINKIIGIRRSLIDIEKKQIYNLPNFTERKYYSNCIRKYNDYKWLDGKVLRLWIAAVPGQKAINKKYILPHIEPINYDGIVWYPANNKFKVLQCLATSRIQNGNILELNLNNKKYEFMIAYTVHGSYYRLRKYGEPIGAVNHKNKRYYVLSPTIKDQILPVSKYIDAFIIQNTELFKDETQYMTDMEKNKKEKIAALLEDYVDPNSLNVAYHYLSDSLLRIAPNVFDYGSKISKLIPEYIKTTVNAVLEHEPKDKNKDLFTAIANIVTYLELPQAQIFRKRIEQRYYTPYNLILLSPEDKLPEIFGNPKVSKKDKEKMTHFITSNIALQVKKMVNILYRKEYPSERHSFMIQDVIHPKIDGQILKRISFCENPDNIANTDPHEIVFYKENNKQYCFPLKQLTVLIDLEGTDTINPATGNKFSKEFIEKIDKTYDLTGKTWSKEFVEQIWSKKGEELESKKEVEQDLKEEKEIFPGLWDIIKEKVDKIEDEIRAKISEDDESESSSDSNTESADEEDNRKKSKMRFNDETKENDNAEDDYKDDGKIEMEVKTTKDTKCEYCKSDVKDDTSYKSIMVNVDSNSNHPYKIVYFCNRQCFENKEKWPKLKNKRKRKENNSSSNKRRKKA